MVNVTTILSTFRGNHYLTIPSNRRMSGMYADNTSNSYLSEDSISIQRKVWRQFAPGSAGAGTIIGSNITIKLPAIFYLAYQQVNIDLKQDTANYLSV